MDSTTAPSDRMDEGNLGGTSGRLTDIRGAMGTGKHEALSVDARETPTATHAEYSKDRRL